MRVKLYKDNGPTWGFLPSSSSRQRQKVVKSFAERIENWRILNTRRKVTIWIWTMHYIYMYVQCILATDVGRE